MKRGKRNQIIKYLIAPRQLCLLVWLLALLIIFFIKCEIKALLFIPLAFLVITIIYYKMKNLINRMENNLYENKRDLANEIKKKQIL
jgi:hypothetical protein